MTKHLIAASALLIATASFGAVDVQKSGNFPASIRRMAIAPLPCSEGVNCVKVEKHLNKIVPKLFSNAAIVGTDDVKQALFEKSITETSKESILEVAKEMGCDAVLLPAVLGSDRKDHWNAWTDYDTGQVHASDSASVQSSVQVIIMDVDGKLLMKGQAVGESYLQTEQTYFAEGQFDKIFRKALH